MYMQIIFFTVLILKLQLELYAHISFVHISGELRYNKKSSCMLLVVKHTGKTSAHQEEHY